MKVYKHSLKSGLLDGSTASCEQLVLIENTANILTYDMSYPRPLNLKPLFFGYVPIIDGFVGLIQNTTGSQNFKSGMPSFANHRNSGMRDGAICYTLINWFVD
jgi:hypothetical protein